MTHPPREDAWREYAKKQIHDELPCVFVQDAEDEILKLVDDVLVTERQRHEEEMEKAVHADRAEIVARAKNWASKLTENERVGLELLIDDIETLGYPVPFKYATLSHPSSTKDTK